MSVPTMKDWHSNIPFPYNLPDNPRAYSVSDELVEPFIPRGEHPFTQLLYMIRQGSRLREYLQGNQLNDPFYIIDL